MGLEGWPWIISDKEVYELWMLMQLFDAFYISCVIDRKLREKMG